MYFSASETATSQSSSGVLSSFLRPATSSSISSHLPISSSIFLSALFLVVSFAFMDFISGFSFSSFTAASAAALLSSSRSISASFFMSPVNFAICFERFTKLCFAIFSALFFSSVSSSMRFLISETLTCASAYPRSEGFFNFFCFLTSFSTVFSIVSFCLNMAGITPCMQADVTYMLSLYCPSAPNSSFSMSNVTRGKPPFTFVFDIVTSFESPFQPRLFFAIPIRWSLPKIPPST